jgi:hypothetical protein
MSFLQKYSTFFMTLGVVLFLKLYTVYELLVYYFLHWFGPITIVKRVRNVNEIVPQFRWLNSLKNIVDNLFVNLIYHTLPVSSRFVDSKRINIFIVDIYSTERTEKMVFETNVARLRSSVEENVYETDTALDISQPDKYVRKNIIFYNRGQPIDVDLEIFDIYHRSLRSNSARSLSQLACAAQLECDEIVIVDQTENNTKSRSIIDLLTSPTIEHRKKLDETMIDELYVPSN